MKILFVSHDANRAGGQLFLLSIMQYLQNNGFENQLLLLAGGVLENKFQDICKVWHISKNNQTQSKNIYKKAFSKLSRNRRESYQENDYLFAKLKAEKFDLIYANTIATGSILPNLVGFLNVPFYTHIHELEFSIQLYSTKKERDFLFKNSTKIIACSNAVAQNLIENHGVSVEKVKVIHSFVDNESVLLRSQITDNEVIKEKYELPKGAFLIGGCGNAEWRKGLDIFIQVASQIINSTNENCHFVWIGVQNSGEYYEQICYDLVKIGIKDRVTFIEQTPDAIELITCLDLFTIVSREDPFPLVMLEAALTQKTIIGFENTGGCSEFIEADAGLLVPYLNTTLMATNIIKLFKNPSFAKQMGQRAKEKVLNKYSFENSILKIEGVLKEISLN